VIDEGGPCGSPFHEARDFAAYRQPTANDTMKKALTAILILCGIGSAAQAQEVKGDAEAGQKLNAMCIGCHGIPGYQSSFPEVHKVPKISGQNAKYIAASLNAYKKGERKHGTMRAIAGSLSEQDIADLSAYYAQNGESVTTPETPAVQPSPEVAALLTKGVCASCHGANFNKPIDGSYPKIAGQYPDYLYVAMKAYKIEGNPHVGRGNAIMAAQVKQFNNKELKMLAEYLGSLPAEVQSVAQSQLR
jgi:cytochrome c553